MYGGVIRSYAASALSGSSHRRLFHDGRFLWVNDHKNSRVVCLNKAGVVVRAINIGGSEAFGGDGMAFWIAAGAGAPLASCSVTTGLKLSNLLGGAASGGKQFYTDGGRILTLDAANKSLVWFNPSEAGTLIKTMAIDSAPTYGLPVAFDDVCIYVTTDTNPADKIRRLDRNGNLVLEKASPAAVSNLDGMVCNGRFLYMLFDADDKIYEISFN